MRKSFFRALTLHATVLVTAGASILQAAPGMGETRNVAKSTRIPASRLARNDALAFTVSGSTGQDGAFSAMSSGLVSFSAYPFPLYITCDSAENSGTIPNGANLTGSIGTIISDTYVNCATDGGLPVTIRDQNVPWELNPDGYSPDQGGGTTSGEDKTGPTLSFTVGSCSFTLTSYTDGEGTVSSRIWNYANADHSLTVQTIGSLTNISGSDCRSLDIDLDSLIFGGYTSTVDAPITITGQ